MAQKPSIPKGTRDFGPIEMARRNYIFDTIREVFALYGFQQIETPAMENLSTLLGKYGEEGDKLLFKVLNSGDYLKGAPAELLDARDSLHLASHISEKGLRYDLTVPFARFVVQHRNDLPMPFKRYQIQPVWRADRPQRGRYREFYQCDADIVGSTSLVNEVELVAMIDDVFNRLGINVAVKPNNRKILSGIAEIIGAPDRLIDITVAIDKIDKIGLENVNAELLEKGLPQTAIDALQPVLGITGDNASQMATLRNLLASSTIGLQGLDEMQFVIEHVEALGLRSEVGIDVSLARGLNYYTGTILEVKALDVAMGSISGGGRYDNLTGVFGMPGLSGVGISFGADRIYDVLNTLNAYPAQLMSQAQVLFLNLGDDELNASMKHLRALRAAGIAAEVYPDAAKMKKQMAYADDRHIPFVAIVGADELAQSTISLKNMNTREQQSLTCQQLIDKLQP